MTKKKSSLPGSKLARSGTAAATATRLGAKKIAFLAKKAVAAPEQLALQEEQHAIEMAKILFAGLCRLRGTALKLAQAICGDALLLPEAYMREFEKAQYRVPPLNQVIIRKAIKSELGAAPDSVFRNFESEAFAAASLGQVHRAENHDGVPLAVKIQYPGIDQAVKSDLAMIRAMVLPLPKNRLILNTIREIESNLREELDYEQEARNMRLFADAIRLPGIRIPEVYEDLSSTRVLTTEFFRGRHLKEWLHLEPPQSERDRMAQAMYDLFCYSVFSKGLLHSDPNLGNYLFLDNGDIGLLDFGSIAKPSAPVVDLYAELWRADFKNRSARLLEKYRSLGAEIPDADPDRNRDFFDSAVYPYCRWIQKAFAGPVFDFGKNGTFAAEGRELLSSQANHPRLQNFSAEFTLLHRTFYGLVQAFHKMGARVKMNGDRVPVVFLARDASS